MARLHELLFDGPRSPVAAMVRKYLSRCEGYRRLLQSTTDETDLLNDVFIALVRTLEAGQYRGAEARPFAFVKTIATRLIRQQALRGRTRAIHTARGSADDECDPIQRVADDTTENPEQAFDRDQIAAWVARLGARLSEAERWMLRARYAERCSHEQIAARLGKPSAGASRIGLLRVHRRIERMIQEMPGCEGTLRGAMARLAAA